MLYTLMVKSFLLTALLFLGLTANALAEVPFVSLEVARAALDLLLNPVDTSGIDTLRATLAGNPNDHGSRLELAVLLNGAGNRSEATDHLIHIIRKERGWNDEAARKQLVQFFEAWGPKDEATLQGRRKLSSVLFA